MSYKQQGGMASNTVRQDADHVVPAPEHTEGVVFPYRGIENHGVKPEKAPPEYVDDQWPEDDESVSYEPGATEDDPIPVRIVNQFSKEFQDFRSFTAYVPSITGQALTQNGPIVGRLDPSANQRRIIHIQNQSSSKALFIGSDNTVSAQNGYRIAANTELAFPITTESEVWGTSEDGTQIPVGVLVEFGIEM
jgi:hypothetical protein